MEPQPTPTRERPGCVTAYAILLSFAGAVLVVMAFMNVAGPGKIKGDWRATVIVLSLGVLCFALVRGLWLLQNWARIAVIALHSLGLLNILLSMIQALTAPASSYSGQVVTRSAICVSGIPLLIGACITVWFILNAKHFDGGE